MTTVDRRLTWISKGAATTYGTFLVDKIAFAWEQPQQACIRAYWQLYVSSAPATVSV